MNPVAERVRDANLPRISAATLSRLIVSAGAGFMAIGVGLMSVPLGVIVAGVALVAIGLLLIPAEG